jgi:hypothetical protein
MARQIRVAVTCGYDNFQYFGKEAKSRFTGGGLPLTVRVL